ncbi:MAG: hypothetical protein NC225_12325 [Clostridium sp.]|nr:hypothetical protein [Clostridium sp.]MCM1400255.1 hypothetical protein [Clostridium sp.]MCM1460968.1 hypothetical protein [Bacteroides sp.]
MKKIIAIGETQVALVSNAATGLRYKQIFKSDVLKDLGRLDGKEDIEQLDAINYISQLAYVMNMQGKGTIKEASEENYIEWLENFEEEDFQNENTIMEILGVWNKNLKTTSEPKNGQSPQ